MPETTVSLTEPRHFGGVSPVGRDSFGFSLIEVVLAIGIVSFGLLALLGVFGGMLGNAGQNFDRRALSESVDALRTDLNNNFGFDEVFDWIKDGDPKDLVYLTYRNDPASGSTEPATEGDRVLGKWFDDPADASLITDYEPAREGRWLRARLSLAPQNVPATISGSDPTDYPSALLLLKVELGAVPQPSEEWPDGPALTTIIGVLR